MTNTNALFTVSGITTDAQGNSKVRWTQDLIRRTKLFAKQGYVRIDLVDLPQPMTKLEALAYISTLPQFDNAGDRMTIEDAAAYREKAKAKADGTYVARPRGRPRKHPVAEVVVKAKRGKVKAAPSLDAIKARAAQSNTAAAVDLLKALA
jgi:hypothetical protein